MDRGRSERALRPRVWAVVLTAALSLCLACATVEPPGGGPVDETPPYVTAMSPDSGAVGLETLDRIELVFSEKVDPRAAQRFLETYPPLEIRKTRWHARKRVEILLEKPLPADTVIILEIAPGYPDVHRVPMKTAWRVPIATADSLPGGRITGRLVKDGEPVANGVVELYAVPPESLTWDRQPLLRRAAADSLGRFSLDWLPAPSGPYLLHAFADKNNDFRVAETEAQRLLPGEFMLTGTLDVGAHVLYAPNTPGRLVCVPPDSLAPDAPVFGWPLRIAESDTGFVPDHQRRAPPGLAEAAFGDSSVWDPAGPGLTRLVLFVDMDGDSLLSALPTDTLVAAIADSTGAPVDSVVWMWEPYALADSLTIEPGLPAAFEFPPLPETLRPCPTPPPPVRAPVDSLAAAVADSLAATPPDSLEGAGPRHGPPDTSFTEGPPR